MIFKYYKKYLNLSFNKNKNSKENSKNKKILWKNLKYSF